MKRKKNWYDFLWVFSAIYLLLGFVNILFAWLGLLCFLIPLLLSVFGGGKIYCNRYCGRGQLLELLGERLKVSRRLPVPRWLKSPWFRYGFLAFFLLMFGNMLLVTYLVLSGAQDMRPVVTLLWTFRLPWDWAYHGTVIAPWVAQFAFGFYSLMLTSTLLGLVTMALFRPRTWCVYCPMGTMTQLISKAKPGARSDLSAGAEMEH